MDSCRDKAFEENNVVAIIYSEVRIIRLIVPDSAKIFAFELTVCMSYSIADSPAHLEVVELWFDATFARTH